MTYAAENASAALMKLLLDAGATPADSYLERNPSLTAADRASGMVKLVTELDRFRGPSFDCSSARTRAERAICGSDTLRIFDVELARAYRALEPRESGAAASQREWLRQRDRECGGRALQDDDYADCLAEMTRTRIRYLHNRLDEQ
jgi:uncharacterized protein